jgi:hypothetical protein
MTLDTACLPVETVTPNYTYPVTATAAQTYVLMSWNASDNSTVTLT